MNSAVAPDDRAELRQVLHQRRPVGQSCRRVDARPVLELRLERALLGDVAKVQHEPAVEAAGQARVRPSLLVELVRQVPFARDVVGQRERVVGAGDVGGGFGPSTSRMLRPRHDSGSRPTSGSIPGLM